MPCRAHAMPCPCHAVPIPCRAHAMPCPCRAHAAPMPFPCHAVSFPIDSHSADVSDSYFPCHAHAMLRPCRSSQGHDTARPSRDGLWTTCPLSASSSYHVELHEVCYQKHTNFRCKWSVRNQTTFVMDEEKSGISTLQKPPGRGMGTACYV